MKNLKISLKPLVLVSLFAFVLYATPTKVSAVQINPLGSIFDSVKLPNAALIKVKTNLDNPNHKLDITFTNSLFAKKVTYELTYVHDGQTEGVVGSINGPLGLLPVQKHIVLGTCSGMSCVYHTGLSNMKLKVTTMYTLFDKVETATYTIL
jgi:hypothetical protein